MTVFESPLAKAVLPYVLPYAVGYAAYTGYDLGTRVGLIRSPGEIFLGSIKNMGEEGGKITHELFKKANESTRREVGYTLAFFGGVGVLTLAAQIAVQVIGAYAQAYLKHIIGRPKLAMEYDFHTWKSETYKLLMNPYNSAMSAIYGKPPVPSRPVFKPEIQKQLSMIASATSNIRKNDGYFSNLLLYGPPGTGKTMVSKLLAKEAGMNYVMMSGGEIAQFIKRGEHVSELNTLFANVKTSSSPTIIFIDEAEGLTRNREKLDMERLELLNAFLNLTGEPSKQFMLILATNRPEDLDSAVISRMDNRIRIGPPEKEERLKILTLYLDKFFAKDKGSKMFDEAFLNRINEQINGFTGRDIFKLCNGFGIAKASQVSNKLTEQLVNEVITKVIENRNEMDSRMKLNTAAIAG